VKISINSTPFLGAKNVFILDGGGHGCSMEHFARAIFKNTDANVKFQRVNVNENLYDVKIMDSLEKTLKELSDDIKPGDFTIIPALALASLRKLKRGIADILNINETLTPQNLNSKKSILLNMLEKIYKNKSKYEKELEYLDQNSQEYGFLWGVIQQINNLSGKGVNMYIPTGHPVDYTIKDLAEKRGQKPDLYRYIATGSDEEGKVKRILDEVKNSGSYNLNLLALSDAHIVNIEGLHKKDYIFSAYDSLANDSERGVYNFYPVRNNSGEVKGYSFQDRSTVEYTYDEYGGNKDIADLLKFTGLKINDFLADTKEHLKLKKLVQQNKDTNVCSDKLYKLNEIYEEPEIRKNKLDYMGGFTTRKRNLVFDVNNQGEIMFQKCNCEGSSRPSVVSMWGSCFAAIKAAKRDFLSGSENTWRNV